MGDQGQVCGAVRAQSLTERGLRDGSGIGLSRDLLQFHPHAQYPGGRVERDLSQRPHVKAESGVEGRRPLRLVRADGTGSRGCGRADAQRDQGHGSEQDKGACDLAEADGAGRPPP